VEKKRAEWLEQRREIAAESERTVQPFQTQLPTVVQMTAQFIRTLRNGILSRARWAAVLPRFQAMLNSYL
jgi:hypothetical protein